MSIEAVLVAIKSANSALNSLIGERFYPDACPQEFELPAARFQEIDFIPFYAMTPTIVNGQYRIQIDFYAATSLLRSALRVAAFGAFNGYSGEFGVEKVKSILNAGERKKIELLDTEAQAYVCSTDWLIDGDWIYTP